MMVNSKAKGSNFEREIVKKLNKKLNKGEFKRIAGSGAIGTQMGIPDLQGDILGEIYGISRKLRGESKVGYGGSKSMTLKKEWLDKIVEQSARTYSLPFLIGRFSGSRSGVEEFVILDFNSFTELLNLISELTLTIDRLSEEC